MIFTKHKKLLAFLVVLALAVSLPAAALAEADTTAPAVSLYSPTTSAATTANQKVIFSLSESVSLVSGHSITVSDGTTTYTADATSGTLVGDATSGPWYAVYDLSDFTNGGTPLTTLTVSTNYTVNVAAGVFADAANNPNAAASGSFTTTDDAAKLAVVFTTSGAGQGATADSTAIVSGQAVANGATVAFSIPAQSGFDIHTAVKVNGTSGSFTLSGAALAGDLEVYITRTAVATKAPYSGTVTKPVALTVTDTSVVLTGVSGYEYMISGGSWQDGTTFSGLTSGQTYDFYQRVKETDTTLASDASEKLTVKTITGITGTAIITGTAQSGKTLTGSLSGSNASGTISYVWQRGGSTVGTGTTYLLGSADVGQVITLYVTASEQSGTLSFATGTVLKAENTTAPAAPTMASATASTITLNAILGYQYSLGGTYWQDTTTFHSLTTGATYTFYQRVAETATTLASPASAGANFGTLSSLTGTINTTGEARYGMTMTATLAGSNNTGTLTYTWKRGTTVVGTGPAYAVSAADISNPLSVEVTSTVQGGIVTKSLGTVAKAYYTGNAPDAPTRYSRSTSKIVLNTVSGVEYSRGGTNWQDSPSFSGLNSGTSYTFYQRYKATATTEASPASDAYKTSTSASTSSDDDTSATPTPKPSTTSSAATALYTYTLTQDNTRILYSTMKSLAEGNKTQDVTIKQADVEFSFAKGTMTDTYTQLWYDFGASINNSIAAQTAEEIAGDAYVATVHYNYSGELPAKANIRLNVGAAQAGKTLYYYLLNADNTLTFQQTAVVDSTGWATVSQTHCSDYVFLSRDINEISPSPELSPTPDAAASPLPSPSVSPDKGNEGIGSDGWFIAAIVLIAVALIVGGIWLYVKNREDKMSDDDEDNDDNNLF